MRLIFMIFALLCATTANAAVLEFKAEYVRSKTGGTQAPGAPQSILFDLTFDDFQYGYYSNSQNGIYFGANAGLSPDLSEEVVYLYVGKILPNNAHFGGNTFGGFYTGAPYYVAVYNLVGYSITVDGVSKQVYVPEPSVWLMMIIGIGVVGGAMRRSRGTGCPIPKLV